MRIVLLTRGGAYPRLLLQHLRDRDVEVAAVVVHTQASLAECTRDGSPARRALELPLALLRSAVRRLRARRRNDFADYAGRTIFAPALNSERTRRALFELQPDLLVLAGCGLLQPPLLSTARVATINGHPGLLPWARGRSATDVVAGALQRGVAIGATCHLVDPGIDTGAILQRRLLRVASTGTTLSQLEGAAGLLTAELVADVVADYVAGRMPQAHAQTERHPLCCTTPELRRELADAVRAGLARRLFEEWEPRCSDAERLVLDARWGLGEASS
jgi:methionyl-tRNA formyltransferase